MPDLGSDPPCQHALDLLDCFLLLNHALDERIAAAAAAASVAVHHLAVATAGAPSLQSHAFRASRRDLATHNKNNIQGNNNYYSSSSSSSSTSGLYSSGNGHQASCDPCGCRVLLLLLGPSFEQQLSDVHLSGRHLGGEHAPDAQQQCQHQQAAGHDWQERLATLAGRRGPHVLQVQHYNLRFMYRALLIVVAVPPPVAGSEERRKKG